MSHRFLINAGGGALPGIVGAVALAPAIGVYLRFIQHESWGVVVAIVCMLELMSIFVAIWGRRMTGQAIELTEEGISFPRMWSRTPETIVWTGIESLRTSFNTGTAARLDRYLELTYF